MLQSIWPVWDWIWHLHLISGTARPRDTRPVGAQTLKVHGFELVPKTLRDRVSLKIQRILHGFLGFFQPHDDTFFPGTKNRVTRGLTTPLLLLTL